MLSFSKTGRWLALPMGGTDLKDKEKETLVVLKMIPLSQPKEVSSLF